MDKIMKAEIGKVIDKFGAEVVKFVVFDVDIHNVVKPHYSEKEIREGQSKLLDTAHSSLTALIIKWLEGKKSPHFALLSNKGLATTGKLTECRTIEDWQKYGRNQLITELIGEVNG